MIYKLGLHYIIPVIRTQLSHNRYYFCILLLLLSITRSSAQCSYTLNDILDKVMCNSPEYRLQKIQSEIDHRTYEINMASLLPSVSMAFSGPSYSKTISPVSQADGSIKYLEVDNLQGNLSLNANVPLEWTGGQFSLNSNLSIYRNNRDDNLLTSYSLNYYHLSYNQPLDFFSVNKWNRRIIKANRTKAELEQTKSLFELKYNTLQLFFEIVAKKTEIVQLAHQTESLQKLYELSKAAYAAGKMLETDLESMAIKIASIANQTEGNKEELNKLFELLNMETGLCFTTSGTNFIYPDFPVFTINTELALSQMNDKIENLYKVQLLSQERATSQLKRKRWGSASLSMGIGMSASANDFKRLSESKITDYNASLNFSFPITGWVSQKKEYENAKLNYEKLVISKQKYMDSQKIELLNLISTIRLNRKTYDYLLNQKQLLQKEENVKRNLFQSQRIIFNELEEVMDRQIQNEQNIIQTIANVYLNTCEIEKMTATDFFLVRK